MVHRQDEAELLQEVVGERERSDCGEERNLDRHGHVPGRPSGHEFLVGKPLPAIDCRLGSCAAVNQQAFGEFGLRE